MENILSPLNPHRFAHLFYTDTPPDRRPEIDDVGRRMTDYVKKKLLPIPELQRTEPMTLSDIVGSQFAPQIEASGSLVFQATGDTGNATSEAPGDVAYLMGLDFDPAKPVQSPAFFLHLGDVNYYDNTDEGYQSQFYVPYKHYPGKIIAIPGNHDGELFRFDGQPVGQKHSLEAFQQNFCQPVTGIPPAAGTIYRQMVSQPGVYWHLSTALGDIIGLYSNMAENPGYIAADTIGFKQKQWLLQVLTNISQERMQTGIKKGLIVATHHPPKASGTLGSHSSSVEMLQDIDDCCQQAGVMPDLFLSAHAHNFQRFTRFKTFQGKLLEIPFLVIGCGGRNLQKVAPATKAVEGDFRYDQSFYDSYGFANVDLKKDTIQVEVYKANIHALSRNRLEIVSIDLATNKVTVTF